MAGMLLREWKKNEWKGKQMDNLIIGPEWIWEEPGFHVSGGEPYKAHGLGKTLCHSGKMKKIKRGLEMSKTSIFSGIW